ncbi:MAG: PKD domain-containing protein [Bacteroidota bacterium]
MQLLTRISLTCCLVSLSLLTQVSAQCITDDCGDIFADWALLSEEITVCEGATFEVANQTIMPDIDFYVWDWGNGDRDTVFEVANHFYTYTVDEGTACSANNNFIVYNISLEIYRFCEEGQSCHTQIAPVAIRLKPRASFDLPEVVCAGDVVPVLNGSCAGDEYLWIFGDGTTSTEQDPEHVFDSTGVFDVTLYVTNECGTDSLSTSIEVVNRPVANVSAGGSSSSTAGCAPFTVSLSNESENAEYFSWTFPQGAGITVDDEDPYNPTLSFAYPGSYPITLTVGNDCGESEWTTMVDVFTPPQINLLTPADACGSSTIALGNLVQTTGDVDALEWTISGPNAPEVPEGSNPTVVFAQPGDYTISVVATSEYCPTASASTTLHIQQPADVAISLDSPDPICASSDPVLLSASPVGGTWSGTGVTQSGLFDPAIAGTGEHELTYIIQDGACTYGDQLEVDIVQSETMTTTEALALCENTAATPLNFSPVGGQWSGPGIVDAANGVFDPNTTGAGSFEVLYEYTDVNGCYLAKTSTVDVQALPVIQAPDTSIFCIESETIILAQELTPSALPAGGNFSWSGTFIGDADNGTFNTPGEGTHPVQLSYSYELCTASTQLFVDISDPGEVVAGPDQSACLTEGEVRLIGSPVGGRWSGPGVTDPFGGVVDLNQIESGAHEYVYTVADDSNCESSDVMQLELTGPGDLEAGIDLAFCADAGEQTLPTATPANGIWSGPHLTDASNGIINTDQLVVESDTWYTYTILDEISGCVFSDSVAVHINEVPEVAFEVPEYQCAEDEIRVEIPAQTGITYTWTVDGVDSYDGNVLELTLIEGGNYPIQLEATNEAGCVGTAREELTVAEVPTPSFNLDSYEGCGPLTLDFADASAGVDIQYYWEFSNGVNSTDANPSGITFLPGVFDTTYQITLQVRNACGEAIYNDDVTVLAKPVADFGVPVNSGCGPLEINFANTTTGSADSYYWDFGNGSTSTEAIPQNQFYTTTDSTATIYDIMMVAYNTCGSDTITRPVTVEPANIVPFFNVSATEGCEPLTVDFTDYSNYGANISWNFGDGTTSVLTDPTHTFDVAGYYTVHQYVTTACGTDSTTVNIEVLPGPDAAFSHPPVVCPDEEIKFVNESSEFLTIFWDFGDGSNSTEAEPTHQFDGPGTYPVTMVVSNADYLCQSSYSSSVTILERPTGYITTEAGSGCPPFDICLEAEFSDADFFEWTFGDSNTSTTLNPCHTFTEPGLYSVSFRAANELGCYSTYDTVKVRVYDEPLAEIATLQEVYCGENQTVNFVNNSSSNATSYEWHFSNGMTSTLSEPTVNFVGTGSYSAELIARNTFGCEDRDNTSFIIAPQPMADFAPITNDGCVPEMVIFDNASVNVTKYNWDFGNGETTEEEQPTTIYRNPGSYDVKLVVSYEDLCFDSLSLQGSINLLQKPTAAFSYEYPTDTYRGIVQFINESVDADTYRWDFSDGNTSNDVHPLHDIGRNGNWQTELIAMADNGCTDTAMVAFEPEMMYELFFPNALSPESGIGDVRVFKPAGIGLEDWTLEIFSPWGQRVYVSEEMEEDQPAAAWDGSYEGKILPQGAYSYKASVEFINGIRRVYTGSVTLIR